MSNNRNVSRPLAEALRKLLADPTATEQAALALRIFDSNHLPAMNKADKMQRYNPRAFQAAEHPHFCIEGVPYSSAKHVHEEAVTRGFDGTLSATASRLKKYDTWEKLTEPMSQRHSNARKGKGYEPL